MLDLGYADFREHPLAAIQVMTSLAWWATLKLLLLAIYPSSALAPPAADGLVDLLAVVTSRAKEHPP